MSLLLETCVIQVTNIAPTVTMEQMSTLFGFIGPIREIQIYPKNDITQQLTKICFVRFVEPWCVGVAQHLTNTVFIDRALTVQPVPDNRIPDEVNALSNSDGSGVGGSANSGVVSQIMANNKGEQTITTIDPRLTALGLPQYPPLPANMDPSKIEEIRRTVYVGNLDSSVTSDQLLHYFNRLGEVKYVRMAGEEGQPTRFAFIEFTDQSSVANALQYNGVVLGGRPLKINHSNNAIVKPSSKGSETEQKEVEEAMKRVREAQNLITAAIEPSYLKFDNLMTVSKTATKFIELATEKAKISAEISKSRSRSRSRSRVRDTTDRRSRSRSRRRSRSRTKRSRSRERSRRYRSRSRDRRRSKSRERRRSRDRSRSRRSRSRSRDRRHRRRSPERRRDFYSPRSRDKDREKERDRERRDKDRRPRRSSSKNRSRSRSRSKKIVDEMEKEKRKERLLREAKKLETTADMKDKRLLNESMNVENSSSEKEECHSNSASPYKNCESSASDEHLVEGPALPPDTLKDDNDLVKRKKEGPSTPPPLKSPKDPGSPLSRRHNSHRDKDRTREKRRKRRSRSPILDRSDGKSVVKDVVRNYDEEEKDYDSSDNDAKSYPKPSRGRISSSQDWTPE